MDIELRNLKAEVRSHFQDYQHVFLATNEGDQPRVRPVTLVNLEQKFWVFTGTTDAKVGQVQKNPAIEFCLPFKEGEHHGYVRATGVAKIVEERETKVKVAKHCDFFSEHFKGFDDPNYTLLELKINEIEYLKSGEERARRFRP
jgi:general stress protein 26